MHTPLWTMWMNRLKTRDSNAGDPGNSPAALVLAGSRAADQTTAGFALGQRAKRRCRVGANRA